MQGVQGQRAGTPSGLDLVARWNVRDRRYFTRRTPLSEDEVRAVVAWRRRELREAEGSGVGLALQDLLSWPRRQHDGLIGGRTDVVPALRGWPQ